MNKIGFALLLIISTAHATAKETNTNMRAGLWEIKTTSNLLLLAQHIPQDQLNSMAQIAKEYGLEMPQLQNGAAISKACITQTMAAQQALPQLHQEELNCTTNKTSRQGNAYLVNFSCNSSTLTGSGHARGTIKNAEHFTGTSQFKGIAQGMPVDEKADIQGHWISANCGEIKPY